MKSEKGQQHGYKNGVKLTTSSFVPEASPNALQQTP
jgi:hypothetical protein